MKPLLGALLVAIGVEFVLAVIGVVTAPRAHGSPLQSAVVAADFSPPSTSAGIATVLNPGVTVAATPPKPPAPSPRPASPPPQPAAAAAPQPAPAQVAATRVETAAIVAAAQSGWGCADALAWLATHSAPGYRFVCPGYAYGHQAMTCNNTSLCPGERLIVIAEPCPAAYENEAHNSWILAGLASGVIDPFGYCR
jgi:hypothetical protein